MKILMIILKQYYIKLKEFKGKTTTIYPGDNGFTVSCHYSDGQFSIYLNTMSGTQFAINKC